MIVIKPITATTGVLSSSTIPEPDTARGEIEWVAGTYNEGDEVIKSSTHRRYRAATTTTDDPEVGILKSVPTWVIVGSSNRYKMFDSEFSESSIATSPLVVEVEPNGLLNAVAGFGVFGAENITVTVTDPIDGVVYNHDIAMQDYSSVTDWYNYFFTPLSLISEFVLLDLPPYGNATVKVTMTGGGDITIATLLGGPQINIGVANYGTSVQLIDYSRREPDGFGGFKIVKRRTSKLVNFDATVQTNNVNYVFKQLQDLSQVAAVWVGSEEVDDPTLVYGYYKDYTNNISSPTITDATITVEGLS